MAFGETSKKGRAYRAVSKYRMGQKLGSLRQRSRRDQRIATHKQCLSHAVARMGFDLSYIVRGCVKIPRTEMGHRHVANFLQKFCGLDLRCQRLAFEMCQKHTRSDRQHMKIGTKFPHLIGTELDRNLTVDQTATGCFNRHRLSIPWFTHSLILG